MKPWKVENSRIVSEDRWHRLRADHCVAENGVVISPYYVLENSEWVCIFPIIESTGEVLLVREYRHGARKVVDGLPGGVVDSTDASAAIAARRELVEETGYDCRSLLPLGAVYANWSNHNNRIHCYLALDCHKTVEQNLDENEDIDVLSAPLEQVETLGFLQQAFHVACLYMAKVKLASIALDRRTEE